MVFSIPIESFYVNYHALRDNEYSHLIRKEYIKAFPDSHRAKIYERTEKRLQLKHDIDFKIF
jgi:hypothetical protein